MGISELEDCSNLLDLSDDLIGGLTDLDLTGVLIDLIGVSADLDGVLTDLICAAEVRDGVITFLAGISIALGSAFADLGKASVDLAKIFTVLMGVSGDSTVLLAEFDLLDLSLDLGVFSFKDFRLD